MATFYIDKNRLDKLVSERDESEKRWWFAHPSSNDQPPTAYELGHEWAATESTWHALRNTFVALSAVKNIQPQPVSFAKEAIRPFFLPAAKRGLLDATKSCEALSEEELLSLRLFIEGAHAVALLVIKHGNWAVAEVK